MENQMTNEQLCKLLTIPVRENNYVPRENPKKFLGMTVKQTPKDFIPIEQRYKNLFEEYYLEKDSELKVREMDATLDIGWYGMFKHEWSLYLVEQDGQKRVIIKNNVQHGEEREESGILSGLVEIAEDLTHVVTLGMIGEDSDNKGSKRSKTTYNLYKGKVEIKIGEDVIELLQLNTEQIWSTENDEEEVCFYEIKADDFVRLFSNITEAKARIVGDKWRYLVPRTDEEIEEWKTKYREMLQRLEDRKRGEAEKKKKKYKGKSASELDKQVKWAADGYFKKCEIDGEMRYCSWSYKYRYPYVEKYNEADITYQINENTREYELDKWRVAYDLFFQTQHWPQPMQKYISNLEKKEAFDAKMNGYKDKVLGFFKGLIGMK